MKETKNNKKMKEEVKNYKEKFEKLLDKYIGVINPNGYMAVDEPKILKEAFEEVKNKCNDSNESLNYRDMYEVLMEMYIKAVEEYNEDMFSYYIEEIEKLKNQLNERNIDAGTY